MKTTHHEQPPRASAPRWSKEQIRDARITPIAPLLEKRRLHLIETGGGNHTVREYPGLIIKDGYWRWPERDLGGNAIDLCLQVLRLGFNDAMLELTQAQAPAAPQPNMMPKPS